ncbi:MAG: MarR family protein [Candidatus Bathyarchaeota archaeon BA1]|nr:MAG: MarR family protein [Candidatus Bathyarchaeota archaeon BA1]
MWLHEVLGSKTKERILRRLAEDPGRDFYSRELSRTIGMSHAAVSSQISPLVKAGLVEEGERGRMKFYKLADNEKTDIIRRLLRLFPVKE